MPGAGQFSDAQIGELVSHLIALRTDLINELLRRKKVPFSGLNKSELRSRVLEALNDGRLTVASITYYLDEVEPGGKQHVYLMRPRADYNRDWRDHAAVRRRLLRRADARDLIDATTPVLMPQELTLASVSFAGDEIIIRAVEARYYTHRDKQYDEAAESVEGFDIELRAYVRRVARSLVTLRWNTRTRHAALHITQATGVGLDRDHYTKVRRRFAQEVMPWLDVGQFRDFSLGRVLNEIRTREQTGVGALTRSRRGLWETPNGSEIEATHPPSTGARA